MPRLTFGLALDFGSTLRPLQAQLERQSALQRRGGWPTDAIGEMADETLECLRRLWSGRA